jgi:hypothetical protein
MERVLGTSDSFFLGTSLESSLTVQYPVASIRVWIINAVQTIPVSVPGSQFNRRFPLFSNAVDVEGLTGTILYMLVSA